MEDTDIDLALKKKTIIDLKKFNEFLERFRNERCLRNLYMNPFYMTA